MGARDRAEPDRMPTPGRREGAVSERPGCVGRVEADHGGCQRSHALCMRFRYTFRVSPAESASGEWSIRSVPARAVLRNGVHGTVCLQEFRFARARLACSSTPLVLSLNLAMGSLTWYLAAMASALVPVYASRSRS